MTVLKDRVALVTGGARGIGAATAALLADDGATVLIVDNDGDAAESTAAALRSGGADVHATGCDITDRPAVSSLFDDCAVRYGGVDLLVNNAGITSKSRLTEFPDADWDRVIDIDLTGVYLCTKHFARLAPRDDRGRAIVNVASMSYKGMTQQIAYVSAKGGVVSMTRGAAMELARDQIRVNCVAPGMIETDLTSADLPGHDVLRERMIPQVPLRRYGQPSEIASVIRFLLGDNASYITGETLHVAGGARL